MKPLNKALVLLLGSTTLLCAYFLCELIVKNGRTPLVFHPALAVLTVVGAGLLIYFGRQVLHLKRRESTWLAPSQAPYVALVAQASQIWSALFNGFLLGELLALWHIRQLGAVPRLLEQIALLVLATLGLGIAAWLVETWCQVDQDDPDQPQSFKTPGPKGSAGCSAARTEDC